MPLTFAYDARTPGGKRVKGTMRALDRRAAFEALRERMLVPHDIRPASPRFSLLRLLGGARPAERLAFFRAYAALESSGVDFSRSFALLISHARTARMREALSGIATDVERGGEKLWTAMSRRPAEFSDLEVAMVAAGEEAGNREEIFDRLAVFLERDERLRKRLGAALFYPALVAAAAAAVSLYLLLFVLPQFGGLFESFGIAPSPLLLAALRVSEVLQSPRFDLALIGVSVFAIWSTIRALTTEQGSIAFDTFRFRVPVLGGALAKASLARIARTLATLLQSGVNQMRALEVAAGVADGPMLSRAIVRARECIATGNAASLEEALAASGHFPPLFIGFATIGAASGTVPAMLTKVADYYEDDVESILTALPAAMQTAVTLGLGAVVAAVVYVVYVPLSTLSASIH